MTKLQISAPILFLVAGLASTPAQTFTTLVNFNGNNGAQPLSALVLGPDGNFYGTTQHGGSSYSGNVFKITPGGTLTTIHSFNGNDGAAPDSGLVLASDGNFYGTTANGPNGYGTVFRITPAGSLTTLHTFTLTDGAYPFAGLIQATDGNFYGTTWGGGAAGVGTVFKITPAGTFTTLHSFQNSDGSQPFAALVQAVDGNFYGTTKFGGANSAGTVFKITSAGTFSTLHNFSGMNEGANPAAGLVQGANGSLYGVTGYGMGNGTVYSITPAGTLTTLYAFDGEDGSMPQATLIQGADGNFYGTTVAGGDYYNCSNIGSNGCGTVFKITPSGVLTRLHSFDASDGANPEAGLLQAANGTFYGTTYWDGATTGTSSDGTVFSLAVPPPASAEQFVPVTLCRLVDTRPQNGGGGPIQGGSYQTFNLPQLAQAEGCASLSSAATYSLNVTLIPQNGSPVGYLTIWPAGASQPFVSTMNSLDGRVKANAAIIPAGASGSVSVFVTNTANIALDIDGYFAPASQQTLQFYPLPPCRVADTRNSSYPQGLGAPHLSGGVARNFPMLNSSCIPSNSNAVAYSLNFTAVPYPGPGNPLDYLEVWATGNQPAKPVSTLNNPTGTYVANGAIVPAGADGEITAYPTNNSDLLIDINGYFATSSEGGLSFYATLPCRVLDTRIIGNGQQFTGTRYPPVDVVDSGCGVPPAAEGYVLNVTAVPSPTLFYLTLWPDQQDQPVVSTLNAADGWVASNMAILPTTNGSIDAYAAGITQLILDITGYFAP